MKYPSLVSEVLGSGVTGATVDITVLSGIPGKCLEASRIVIENETSNATVARLGIIRSGQFITVDYKAAFNQDIPQVWSDWPIPVYEYDQLVIRCTGTTTADLLRASAVYSVIGMAEYAS